MKPSTPLDILDLIDIIEEEIGIWEMLLTDWTYYSEEVRKCRMEALIVVGPVGLIQ